MAKGLLTTGAGAKAPTTNPNTNMYNNPFGYSDDFKQYQQTASRGFDAYNNAQDASPYRGGLTTDFRAPTAQSGQYAGGAGYGSPIAQGKYAAAFSDSDSDVRGAANAYAEMTNGNAGTSHDEQQALYNMYSGRIGEKNSLAESIAGSDDMLKRSQDQNKLAAGEAVGEGLRHTRENYNSRGLLYSGAREGGEQKVRSAGAGQLAASMTGTARDAANLKASQQAAYMSVDLANHEDTIKRASEAFDTASANNIARLQAMQQLGNGIGQAAGAWAGSQTAPGNTPQPSGPSNYNTASTNYYDSGNSYSPNSGLMNRTA